MMVVFMLLGGFDKITKKKFNLGFADGFEEGFRALGALSLSMLGILSFAPVLTKILLVTVGPVFEFLGADPAMIAGSFLGMDMGAYSVAHQMADAENIANFSGLILGGTMGNTMVFNIPVAIAIMKKEDYPYLAKGVLYGITTIPIGCIAGGLAAGYDIGMILKNLFPIILFTAVVMIGLKKIPMKMIKGFKIFGDLVVAMIILALMAAIIESLTGIVIIPGMAPISEGFEVIGNIAIVLAGAFPMVAFLTKKLNKPLGAIGQRIGINDTSTAGLIASMASNIPMYEMMKSMNVRGKIINSAFVVSGTFIIGGDLAFTASVNREMILPVIIGKGVGAVTAIIVAWFATRKMVPEEETVKSGFGQAAELPARP